MSKILFKDSEKPLLNKFKDKEIVGMMYLDSSIAIFTKDDHAKLMRSVEENATKHNWPDATKLLFTALDVSLDDDNNITIPQELFSYLPTEGTFIAFDFQEKVIISKWINRSCVSGLVPYKESFTKKCSNLNCITHPRKAKLARRHELLLEIKDNPSTSTQQLFELIKDVTALMNLPEETRAKPELKTHVYIHKCQNMECRLEYAIYSEAYDWNEKFDPFCPECGKQDSALLKKFVSERMICDIASDGNISI